MSKKAKDWKACESFQRQDLVSAMQLAGWQLDLADALAAAEKKETK